MAGWMPVTDQKPLKGGKWETVKIPMLGVRYCDMEDGTGYLALRYAAVRYVYEGVPKHIYEKLQTTRCASIYWRRCLQKEHYPCVDVMHYQTLEAYQADQGPVKEKLEKMAQIRLENIVKHQPMEMNLFGEVVHGNHRKRREKRLIGGLTSEEGS